MTSHARQVGCTKVYDAKVYDEAPAPERHCTRDCDTDGQDKEDPTDLELGIISKLETSDNSKILGNVRSKTPMAQYDVRRADLFLSP